MRQYFEIFRLLYKIGVKPKDLLGLGGDVVKMGKSLFNTRVNPKLLEFIAKKQKIPTKIVEQIKIHARTLKNVTESQRKLFEANIKDVLNALNPKIPKPTLKFPTDRIKDLTKAKSRPPETEIIGGIQTTRGLGDLFGRQLSKALQQSKPPVTSVQRPATSVKKPGTADAFKGWKPTVIKGGKDKLATGGIAAHFRKR